MFAILEKVYPQFRWEPLERNHVPKAFWNSFKYVEQKNNLILQLKFRYDIQKKEDWYRLPGEQIATDQLLVGMFLENKF